ncbi:hypothetical protein HYY75_06765 [bacterium]|nr:hypothetical protein [bacterium]
MSIDPVFVGLESKEPKTLQKALIRAFSDRRVDLSPKIRDLTLRRNDEAILVLAARILIEFEKISIDSTLMEVVLSAIKTPAGFSSLTDAKIWKYLIAAAPSDLVLKALFKIKPPPPEESLDFIEFCLGHPDPKIRGASSELGSKSLDPRLFARTLSLSFDPDERVALSAFNAIRGLNSSELSGIFDKAIKSTDSWVLEWICSFFPILAIEDLRGVFLQNSNHTNLLISRNSRKALARLDRKKEKREDSTTESPSLTILPPESEDFMKGFLSSARVAIPPPTTIETGFGESASPPQPISSTENPIGPSQFTVKEESLVEISPPPEPINIPESASSCLSSASPKQEFERRLEIAKSQFSGSILSRYPSFIKEPYSRLFVPSTPTLLLQNLKQTMDSLVGFLNLTFLQTYLFFAERTSRGDKAVVECLRSNLIGSDALKFLHQEALALKPLSKNSSFFPFSLSEAMTEGSENLLIPLRELYEFLLNPPPEFAECLEDAVSAASEIIVSFKSILKNSIVAKTKIENAEVFLDLSGPLPQTIEKESWPSLPIPIDEIVVLSRDQSEALGLFPFFSFNGCEIIFSMPPKSKIEILIERLEIKELYESFKSS